MEFTDRDLREVRQSPSARSRSLLLEEDVSVVGCWLLVVVVVVVLAEAMGFPILLPFSKTRSNLRKKAKTTWICPNLFFVGRIVPVIFVPFTGSS